MTTRPYRPYLTERDKKKAELIQAYMRISGFEDDTSDIISLSLDVLGSIIQPVLRQVALTDAGIPEIVQSLVEEGIGCKEGELEY